jgi:amino acid transporter
MPHGRLYQGGLRVGGESGGRNRGCLEDGPQSDDLVRGREWMRRDGVFDRVHAGDTRHEGGGRIQLSTAAHHLPLIIEQALGRVVSAGFFVLVGISILARGLVIMASGSRMVYALARDNSFVGNAWLRRISSMSSAPVPAILFVTGVAIVVELFSDSLEQLLAAAVVLPAFIYLMTIIAFGLRRGSMPASQGHSTLGRPGAAA